jgi:hydrogenase nickel incorporation protein HypA/HybF
MHELSIAYNLVSAANAAAEAANVNTVTTVNLQLGVMSGVVPEALLFSYDIATDGTRLAGSTLSIEMLPVVVFCDACGSERELENIQSFCCPVCQKPTGDIRQGREIELISLEFDDELLENETNETAHT